MKRSFLAVVMLLLSLCSQAQRERIDSLLQVLQRHQSDSAKAKIYFQLGKDYHQISGDTAERYIRESLTYATATGMTKIEAEDYSVLGVIEKNRANYEQALKNHLKALGIKERTNDEHGQAITYNDIGVLYKIMGRFDEALENYLKSNELCKKVALKKGVAMTYNNIGTIYREKHKPDTALFYYRLALAQSEEMNDPYSISTCLSNVGDIYTEMGKQEEALSMFTRSLRYDRENEDKAGMVISYNNVARTLSALGRYAEAIRYSDSAVALTFAEKLNHERTYCYAIRTIVEEDQGNYKQALAYQKMLASLKDSLMTDETDQHISDLKSRYDTEKIEQQIALQSVQIKKRDYMIAGAGGILVLATLLSVSWYRRYRLRQQARLQEAVIYQQELATHAVIEAEERERKRIAGDLHDGVGQLMSAAKMNLSMVASELNFENDDQRTAFDKAMSLVDEGCREVRTVSHNIMPNALLKSGLSTAIREFVNKIDQRVIKVHLYTEGLNERINGNIESVLYRVVQECVNNVIKHAGATQLDISLIKDEEGISLTIEDNGRGFNLQEAQAKSGIGLKNIESRVDYLKGTVEWDAAPGKGTVVMVHVPVV